MQDYGGSNYQQPPKINICLKRGHKNKPSSSKKLENIIAAGDPSFLKKAKKGRIFSAHCREKESGNSVGIKKRLNRDTVTPKGNKRKRVIVTEQENHLQSEQQLGADCKKKVNIKDTTHTEKLNKSIITNIVY